MWRGCEYTVRYEPHTMLDVLVADDMVDDVVGIVMEAARTGSAGDGRIFVIPVQEAYTIRTRTGGLD